MYATTIDTTLHADALSSPSLTPPDPQALRRTLDAVYRERWATLHEVARRFVRKDDDASDAVQDAFLHVLEHPPRDASRRVLGIALEDAVRVMCGRQRRTRRDEEDLKIGLRRRFPV